MRILLGNNTLSLLAGSETWTYTLALELHKLGHSVSCYSPELGIWAEKLSERDIRSYSHFNTEGVKLFSPILEEVHDHQYDVIIANHFHVVTELRHRFPKTPIISTIHGIIHYHEDGTTWAPEHPALEGGVQQFIAVSEEVQDLLRTQYSLESQVIRNFFDIKRFESLPEANAQPKQFLINTNYAGVEDPAVQLIRATAKIMGVKVAAIGMNFSQNMNPESAIKDCDVVFGMGRSVLEGVAAGRLGIVLGRWGYGGVITEASVKEIRAKNFSGRNSTSQDLPTPEDLAKQINEFYQPTILEWGKTYIARDHNVAFAVDQFLRIAKELTGQDINKPAVPTGVAPGVKKLKKAYAD
jgi:glycosyltransferase involved in cell wall biosynthesis